MEFVRLGYHGGTSCYAITLIVIKLSEVSRISTGYSLEYNFGRIIYWNILHYICNIIYKLEKIGTLSITIKKLGDIREGCNLDLINHLWLHSAS